MRHDRVWLRLAMVVVFVVILGTIGQAALDPPAWPAKEDFEAYTVGEAINGRSSWESADTLRHVGWIVTNDGAQSTGHKYLRFWPTPWPDGFSFASNYATWHVHAPWSIAGLALSLEYFVQHDGALKVFVSGDNATWVEVTDRLALIQSDPCFFNHAQTDLKAVIGDAHITTDVYVQFRAYAKSPGTGSYWVSAVDSIGLDMKGPMGTRASGPQILPRPTGQDHYYLTGQLHTHWMNDLPDYAPLGWFPDKTPQELAAKYKDTGYSFVALTEHHPGDWGEGRGSTLQDNAGPPTWPGRRWFAKGMFPGPAEGIIILGDSMEDTADDSHVLAVGFDRATPLAEYSSLIDWNLVGRPDSGELDIGPTSWRAPRLDNVRLAGGLAFVAHPNARYWLVSWHDYRWSPTALIHYARVAPYNGIEVFNGAAPWGNVAIDKWTAVLHSQSSKDVYATAGDDYCPGWPTAFDTGSVTIVEDTIAENSVSKAHIEDWLAKGQYYVSGAVPGESASGAPKVIGWWYDSYTGRAHLRVSSLEPLKGMWFYTDRESIRDKGEAVTPVASGDIWEASFACTSDDNWVRAEVADVWDRCSLTQPIWLNPDPGGTASASLSAAVPYHAADITGPVVLDLADAHLEVSSPQSGLSSVTGDLVGMDEKPESAPPFGYVGYCYSLAPAVALAGENTLSISYDPADADLFPESALSIYWYDPGAQAWVALPSSVDTTAHTVSANITALGLFTLSSEVAVDTTAPTIEINQPSSSAISGQLQLQVMATDDNGVASVQFFLDDVLLGTATARGLGWGWPLDCSLFSNGDHLLRMVATDGAGNSSEVTKSVTISGGVALPVLTIASPSAAESFWNRVQLQGTWAGQKPLFGGVVMLDDVPISAISVAGSDWSAEVSIPGDLYGEHTIAVLGRDEPGNRAQSSVSVVFNCFSDIPIGYWARDQIYATARVGIVQGYTQDDLATPENEATYGPDVPVTRDQMAVYTARALAGDDADVPEGPLFPTFGDVLADHWAYSYIEYCYAYGVVNGYSDGYHPDEEVNRGQMAVYVARAIAGSEDAVPEDPDGTPFFSDVAPDFWAYKHIEYCHDSGIVAGYDDGTYQPGVVVTRDQMAVYVQRAFQLPL